MPITRSAKKALRQAAKRNKRNRARKETYKNAVKKIKKLVAAKQTNEAEKMLTELYRALDKAAKVNAIKKNKAGRLKSRLTKLVQKKENSIT